MSGQPSVWISTKDLLPDEGQYVLAIHTRGSWIDRGDPERVNCVVVKLVRGKTREQLQAAQMKTIQFGDQEGNNRVPYAWEQFGPDSFFGQDISHWTPIPPLPEGRTE